MNPDTGQTMMIEYGNQAPYMSEPANQNDGHAPLDTLPAAWWNWLWNQITRNNNEIYATIGNIRDELLSILSEVPSPITPSSSSNDQVYQAIQQVRKVIATAADPGAVRSSSEIKSVSVTPETGQMLVNALNDWIGSDTIKTVIDNNKANAQKKDVADVEVLLDGNTLVFRIISTDNTVHQAIQSVVSSVSLSKPTTNSMQVTVNGVSGLPRQVVETVAANVVGQTLTISVNGVSTSVDLSPILTHAESATYLRPAGSTSIRVTADDSGRLSAHTLRLS